MTAVAPREAVRLRDHAYPEVERLMPGNVCRQMGVLPYAVVDGHVLVAVSDDSDEELARHISQYIAGPLTLVQHGAPEIAEAIAETFPLVGDEESSADREANSQLVRMLTTAGLLAPEDLARAEETRTRTGEPLGELLVAQGAISEDTLVAALSEQYGMQRVGLADHEPDLEVAQRLPEPLARSLFAVPVAVSGDLTLVAVARPFSAEQTRLVEDAVGTRVRTLLASRTELDQLLQRVHSEMYSAIATDALRQSRPDESAHTVFTVGQKIFAVAVLVLVVLLGILFPIPTLIGVVGFFSFLYILVSVYRVRLTLKALGHHLETDVTEEDIAALDDRTLPDYTILVPLYKEAGIVERLVRDLNALDYPLTKLDVKLLCEADDDETIDKVRSLALPPHFHLVVVPDSQPKTKPKACNYGLLLATGSYCVIFDAEDRPDPDQLKKAIVAFEKVDPEVVCVQAKLNHFNQHQNLLTSWFANEYSMHFELLLPAMGATNTPIPLGGTSNHFVTEKLRELGAWDPFNVTEDADLGIRLHREGYRTAMIDSTTLEEANSSVPNWIRQRSRWNKGYMQTWLVHMRNPFQLIRLLGLRSFVAFNLILGHSFLLLLNPIFWVLTTMYFLTEWGFIRELFPGWVFYAAAALLFIGNFIFIYLNVAGSLQRGEFSLTRTAMLSPLYWGLMSWGAWKGFIQLFTNPFYWEKTEHGLDEGA